jgi:hypothetical protein
VAPISVTPAHGDPYVCRGECGSVVHTVTDECDAAASRCNRCTICTFWAGSTLVAPPRSAGAIDAGVWSNPQVFETRLAPTAISVTASRRATRFFYNLTGHKGLVRSCSSQPRLAMQMTH